MGGWREERSKRLRMDDGWAISCFVYDFYLLLGVFEDIKCVFMCLCVQRLPSLLSLKTTKKLQTLVTMKGILLI